MFSQMTTYLTNNGKKNVFDIDDCHGKFNSIIPELFIDKNELKVEKISDDCKDSVFDAECADDFYL